MTFESCRARLRKKKVTGLNNLCNTGEQLKHNGHSCIGIILSPSL